MVLTASALVAVNSETVADSSADGILVAGYQLALVLTISTLVTTRSGAEYISAATSSGTDCISATASSGTECISAADSPCPAGAPSDVLRTSPTTTRD